MRAAIAERRSDTRSGDNDRHGITGIQAKRGWNARLIDISSGGVLLETQTRLRPGSIVDLRLVRRTDLIRTRGIVVRCYVARLRANEITYRGAVQFESRLQLGNLLNDMGTTYSPCA